MFFFFFNFQVSKQIRESVRVSMAEMSTSLPSFLPCSVPVAKYVTHTMSHTARLLYRVHRVCHHLSTPVRHVIFHSKALASVCSCAPIYINVRVYLCVPAHAQICATWSSDLSISESGCISNLLNCIHVSLTCIWVPPTVDAWRDTKKPYEEKGNEEIETWDILSSEASHEVTSVSEDGSCWSQLDRLSISFDSYGDYWWILCLRICSVLTLTKMQFYHWESSNVFSM